MTSTMIALVGGCAFAFSTDRMFETHLELR
jgi:hypothetical protein